MKRIIIVLLIIIAPLVAACEEDEYSKPQLIQGRTPSGCPVAHKLDCRPIDTVKR